MAERAKAAQPRVDFYVLDEEGEEARRLFACRLAEKATKNRHSVVIKVRDAEAANDLDALLWSYKAESFLPHEQADGSEATTKDLVIKVVQDSSKLGVFDMLINLGEAALDENETGNRIAEIVVKNDAVLHSTRRNYTIYKKRGFDISTHKIGG